uniref:Opsin n=1 Tax=Panagrolaimus davidi TaxID=227884 RepID=A0A914P856_9BILA
MFDKDLLKNSCYKLMLLLAFLDLNMSVYNGVWTGLVSVTGNVFCHWPTLAYWIGNGSGAAWKMQSTATVLLAFNRCIEAFDEKLANIIFKGKRTFFWMCLPIAWGFFDFLVGPPGFFNPIYSVIMYNPHAGYFNDYTKTVCLNKIYSREKF